MPEHDAGRAAVEAYLAGVAPERRKLLQDMRKSILEVAPDAREHISYSIPAFAMGKAKVGFANYSGHMTFFPFSGSFLDGWWDKLPGFAGTKSGVHFTVEKPIPKAVLRAMVKARLAEGRAAEGAKAKAKTGKSTKKPAKKH